MFENKSVIHHQVIEMLKTVFDPEIPVNIYDLGMIYETKVDDENNVYIKMTLTSPSCPVAGSLPGDVRERIENIPEINDVYVDLVWDPPWSMDKMTEEAKLELGLF